jgi:hypothetical protein
MSATVEVILYCDFVGCGRAMVHGNMVTVRGMRGFAERNGWGMQHMAGNRHPKASMDRSGNDLCPEHYAEYRGAKPTPTLFDEVAA